MKKKILFYIIFILPPRRSHCETCFRSRFIRKAHYCSTTLASNFSHRTTVNFPLRNKQKLLYMRFRFVLSKHRHFPQFLVAIGYYLLASTCFCLDYVMFDVSSFSTLNNTTQLARGRNKHARQSHMYLLTDEYSQFWIF